MIVRNRAGARLTANGEAFVVYANQLVQTWEAARRDLPLPEGYHNVLHIGGEVSLCNPLMLSWAAELREKIPGHALRMDIRDGENLLRQLELGVLDAALVYQPEYWPGLQVEQVLEEKLILVTTPGRPAPYVYIDWGPDFRRQHDAALPEKAKAALADHYARNRFNLPDLHAELVFHLLREFASATGVAASHKCPLERTDMTQDLQVGARFPARPENSQDLGVLTSQELCRHR